MKMFVALAFLVVSVTSTNLFAMPPARVAVGKHAPIAWNLRVTMTPDGGFLVGNPSARAKLVEYGSLTCPYCQRFHSEAATPLRARIATGIVSFEFRPFRIHRGDSILHALLLCAGPARFKKFSDDFFKSQAYLVRGYEAWADSNPTVNPSVNAADRIRFSDQWGFTGFATAHGMTRARVAACLSNNAALALQRQRDDRATRILGVQGTPSLFLNEKPVAAENWVKIDLAITATLG